jgi:hypothetical protein
MKTVKDISKLCGHGDDLLWLPGAERYNEVYNTRGGFIAIFVLGAWTLGIQELSVRSVGRLTGQHRGKKFVFARPSLCAAYVSKISMQFSWHLPNRCH